jgi:ubiquinone/menaquinone biosynthesis C-methylase UbiE
VNTNRDDRSSAVRSVHRLLFSGPHTCPWWLAYTFDNPLRRLVHDPASLLRGLVAPGQTAVDIGCGLGYFSLALAELVGSTGQVVALDVQPEMIRRARRRAERRGVADRIDFRVCAPTRLGFTGVADFVLAFWMVHEAADQRALLAEVRSFLRPAGHLLIAEPKGHVSLARFVATAELARRSGFAVAEGPRIRFSRSAVCTPLAQSVDGVLN